MFPSQHQCCLRTGSGRDYFDAMFNDVSSKSTMYKKLSETKYGGSSVQQDLINSTGLPPAHFARLPILQSSNDPDLARLLRE